MNLDKLAPIIDFVEDRMRQDQEKTFDENVGVAVDAIGSGDAFKDVPEHLMRSMVIARSVKNKDFTPAFENRNENPAAWDAALTDARADFAETVKGIARKTPKQTDVGPSIEEKAAMSHAAWNSYIEGRRAKVE